MTTGTKTSTRATRAKDTEAEEIVEETPAKKPATKATAKKSGSRSAKNASKTASSKSVDNDDEIDDDEVDAEDIEDGDDTSAEDDADDDGDEGDAKSGKKGSDGASEAKKSAAEPLPTGAIVISSNDDEDVPIYSTQITGATADPVKDYLKQIGKVPLLNAAEEVELAMRIEAGLFAEEKLSNMSAAEKSSQLGLDLQWVARDG
ncbi:MAG TPA: RNA polymerase sigma factor, partial [Microbacterium sp.]|nr:RNA polymerase sigma factor [Microbacterium sp.]